MEDDILFLYCASMPELEDAAPKTPPETSAANPRPRPEGEPAAVVTLRELIESKLAEVVERYGADDNGAYVFGLESALVYVVPAWLEGGATVVRIFAITNLDVKVTPELTKFLLGKNLDFVLGGFALDSDNGAVWFHHNLLGEYLAPEELEATLGAVAATANDLDDEIKGQFGGRLYIETPDESIPPPVAPGYL